MEFLSNLKNKVKNNRLETLLLFLTFAGIVFILIKDDTFDDKTKYTDIFSVFISAVTLVALIYYARDTHRIADINYRMWMLEQQPRGIYEMYTDQMQPHGGRTIFKLTNMSDYILDVRVSGNFRVYNQPVQPTDPAINGGIWTVYPHQVNQSYFEIEPILQSRGYSIDSMVAARTLNNHQDQLTMDLEIKFTNNDTGQVRNLPARRHFFDFAARQWVPRLLRPLVP